MSKHRAGRKKRARIQYNVDRKRLQTQLAFAEISRQLISSKSLHREPSEKPKVTSEFKGYFTTEGYLEHLRKQGRIKPILKVYPSLNEIKEVEDNLDNKTIVIEEEDPFAIEIITTLDLIDLTLDSAD